MGSLSDASTDYPCRDPELLATQDGGHTWGEEKRSDPPRPTAPLLAVGFGVRRTCDPACAWSITILPVGTALVETTATLRDGSARRGSSRRSLPAGRSRGSTSTLPAGALLGRGELRAAMRRSDTTGPPFWAETGLVEAAHRAGRRAARPSPSTWLDGDDAGAADADHAHARTRRPARAAPARAGRRAARGAPARRACFAGGIDREERRAVALAGRSSRCCRTPGGSASCGRTRSRPAAPTGSSTSRRSRRSPRRRAR